MTSMELRRRVVPPKRYEPELSDGERYMPSVRKPLFRPPYVDFNPHLPPAAFPTLDGPVRTLSESNLVVELGEPWQHLLPTQSEPTAQDSGNLQQRPQSSHPPVTPFVVMEDHMWDAGIYPHNPEYFQSLASLESGLSQEELEWNMQEMETSDEDEDSGERKSAFMKAKIIQGLLVEGKTKEQATGALGLSTEQWQDTVAWDHHRLRMENKEETRIATMQDEVNSLLLNRDGMGFTSINSTTYEALLSHHLAAFMTGKMDFSTTSKRDLVNAQNYLKSRGLPLSLVGQWMEPYVGIPIVVEKHRSQITAGSGEGQEHATKDIGQESMPQDTVGLRAMNTSGEELVATKGRSPVRRKYVHLDDETPSARPRAIPTGQAMKNISSNLPSLKLNNLTPHQPHQMRRPGSITTNTKNTVMQEPSKPDVFTSNTSLVAKDLAQPTNYPASTALPQSDTVEDLSSMTIVVQPKRTWSGTAKPGRTTFFPNATLHTPVTETSIHNMWKTPSGNPAVSKQSSEALERLRIESMKYSGRSVAGLSEQAGVNNASASAGIQNIVKRNNPQQLAVGASNAPSTAPKEKTRRVSTTSSTTRSSTASTITPTPTPTPRDRSTPATPDLPSSGSSTRSPMATRKPSRYRDGSMNAASPTDSITGRRTSNPQAVPVRTQSVTLYSSVYELSKTDERSDHLESAPGLHMIRRSSTGPLEKKQTVSRQSTQPISPQPIPADSQIGSRRGHKAESAASMSSSIEVAENITAKSGGKAPRKAPSKLLNSGPITAEKTAVSKGGGKAPRKTPSKPPISGGKAPRKTPSKPPSSGPITAEGYQSDTAKETAKLKVVKAKAKKVKP
ncbi:hypothetical protein MMC18_007936 [Xylographa bjoerkii]|nr:hypothetical protein [Xylographa bjoerkii]